MSYDVWLEIDTGGLKPVCVSESINHTSNTAEMWDKALGYRFEELKGKLASNCINDLQQAVYFLVNNSNRQKLKAMEPDNGWGTLETATKFIIELLEMCRLNPKATVVISY